MSEADRLGDAQGEGRWTAASERRADSLYAAVDLGTNNCRLLVATPTRDGFRVVDS